MVTARLDLDKPGQPYRLMNVLPQDKPSEDVALEAWRQQLSRVELVDAWVNTLEAVEWTLYAHLTFRRDVAYGCAHKQFMKWINHHNRVAFGATYSHPRNRKKCQGGLYWARSTELQRRSTIHFHAVVCNHSDRKQLVPELAAQRWRKLAGDARVQQYDPSLSGLAYLVKTAADDHSRIDVSDNLVTALTLS